MFSCGFKPRLRRWDYADLAFAVSSPGLGKLAIPALIRGLAPIL